MTVRTLRAATALTLEVARRDTGHDGNLEGLFHEGVTLGDAWVYRNPFVPAPWPTTRLRSPRALRGWPPMSEAGPHSAA